MIRGTAERFFAPGHMAGGRARPRVMAATITAALVAVAAAAVIAAAPWSSTASGGTNAGSALHFAGRAPAGERISFTLVLRLPGAARLAAALRAIENPRSREFRKQIAPAAFGARFGLPARSLMALRGELSADGVQVLASYPQRTDLRVGATVGTVERLFSIRIGVWRGAHGARYLAPLESPRVPAKIGRAHV